MVEVFATSPLAGFLEKHYASQGGGVFVEVIEDRSMAQIFAVRDKTALVERTLKIKCSPGKATSSVNQIAIPLSPRQWMLVSGRPDPRRRFVSSLATKLEKNGHVSEQSDARVIFRTSGPRATELLQKGCRLDLHPQSTGKDWCAQTQMAQIGVILHQINEKPVYDLYVYAGFAQDFAEWLAHTGAQLGISFHRA